ncbi:MAG: shikimate dehydrogenase [Lentisphaeria bacterium]|nr:shikimate dehydrogenase [Lentisphaeria bacterium]
MKQFGIIGWPVSHSLSPVMHNAGFKAINYDADYKLFPVDPQNLESQINQFRTSGVSGWNVTVPFKEEVIQYIDVLDPVAEASQSVNTVLNIDGQLFGFSTDGFGLQRAIEEAFDVEIKGKDVLFVGAGGAAQAAAVQFAQAGCRSITVLNRTLSKAEKIIERVLSVNPEITTFSGQLGDRPQNTSEISIIVQCTSLELKPGQELGFDLSEFSKACCCMDMIYNLETPFLKKAQAYGMRVATGSDMLLYQGTKAFEIWTKHEAPVEVMRHALKQGK